MSDPALDALRYPVGKFHAVTGADRAARAKWIDEIAHAPANVARLVQGLSPKQLLTPYREGGWTLAQVVNHMADSHANAYIRTRFAIAEDNFTVKPYDEKRWAEFPDATDADVVPSLDLLKGMHARWVKLLRTFTDADFARPLLHPERGPMTVDWLTQLYAWHGRHHAAHIANTRTQHGW